jgi:type I restriction enzyme S subunit
MELKKGYKETEVGVIPEDWKVEPLGSVGHWFSGGTPSMTNELFWDGEIPWVSAKDMKVARLRDSLLHVTEMAIGNGTRLVPVGAVLMVVRGMILAHTLPVAVAARPVAFNQDMKALVARAGVESEFILLWLQANAQKVLAITSEATHGTKRIPSEDLFSMKVALPSSSEQRGIAAALRDVDGLIGGLEQLIAKKRDLKQAAMQQLLTGKKRLAGFHGEWEVKRLGDLFAFKNCLNKAKDFFGYGTPIVNYMDVYGNRSITAGDLQGRVSLSRDELKAFEVRKGDVFFTRTSETAEEVGMTSVLVDEPEDTVFSGFILRARPQDDDLDDQFKKYCFSTSAVRKQITSKSTETTRALTNGRYLSAVSIAYPPKPEQTAIAEVLSDMDAELAALEQRRDKTRALKQGMMQELLTGRTRLI